MPEIVPRWEWRVAGEPAEAAARRLADIAPESPHESDETYVLSMHGDAGRSRSATVSSTSRSCSRSNGAGLQLWVPTVGEGTLPARRRPTVATVRDALRVHRRYDKGANLRFKPWRSSSRRLIGSRDDLRAVEVHKSRRREAVLDGCMVELTELTDGRGDDDVDRRPPRGARPGGPGVRHGPPPAGPGRPHPTCPSPGG